MGNYSTKPDKLRPSVKSMDIQEPDRKGKSKSICVSTLCKDCQRIGAFSLSSLDDVGYLHETRKLFVRANQSKVSYQKSIGTTFSSL